MCTMPIREEEERGEWREKKKGKEERRTTVSYPTTASYITLSFFPCFPFSSPLLLFTSFSFLLLFFFLFPSCFLVIFCSFRNLYWFSRPSVLAARQCQLSFSVICAFELFVKFGAQGPYRPSALDMAYEHTSILSAVSSLISAREQQLTAVCL